MKTRILFLTTLLCAASASMQLVHAATTTVTNTNDSGAGSLRQALADANDGDTINFSVTGTIQLTSGELVVDKSVTISGPGAANLTINGIPPSIGNIQGSVVFHIASGKTVTISGLTITSAPDGIHNDHATLTVTNSTLSGNSGSGVDNDGAFSGGATLTVTNSTLSGNHGGGIHNNGRAPGGAATATVTNCTLSGNSAPLGGGIFNDGFNSGNATLTVTSSTL